MGLERSPRRLDWKVSAWLFNMLGTEDKLGTAWDGYWRVVTVNFNAGTIENVATVHGLFEM